MGLAFFKRLYQKKMAQEEEIKKGDIVDVVDGSGNLLRLNVTVTAISECKQYIQTSAGISYMPAKQIIKK